MVACKDNNQCQGCKVGMHKVRLGFPEFKKPSDSDSMNFKISDWIWTQKVQFKLPVFLGVLLLFWLLPNWLPDSAILIYMVANNHFLWKKIELWQFIKHSTECVFNKRFDLPLLVAYQLFLRGLFNAKTWWREGKVHTFFQQYSCMIDLIAFKMTPFSILVKFIGHALLLLLSNG